MTTLPATRGKGGVERHWTRENVIAAIQRWVDLYGEPPRAADWNPSSAKFSKQTWRVPRYEAGDPDTGAAWPSLNAAKRPFDGSLNKAVVAAGFAPAKSGPRRKADVTPELMEKVAGQHPLVTAALQAADSEIAALKRRVEARDGQLERARNAADRAREERDAARRVSQSVRVRTRVKTKTVTKTKLDRAALREAVADARADAKQSIDDAKTDAREARAELRKVETKLERAKAPVDDLRAEVRELRRDLARTEDKRAAAVARAERLASKPEPEVRVRVEREVVELPAPEAREVDAARKLAGEAERMMAEADLRVAKAEREVRELGQAVTGEARRLTAAELADLRKRGPAGAEVLAEALGGLARARKEGGKAPLKVALTSIASAAVSWRDRL